MKKGKWFWFWTFVIACIVALFAGVVYNAFYGEDEPVVVAKSFNEYLNEDWAYADSVYAKGWMFKTAQAEMADSLYKSDMLPSIVKFVSTFQVGDSVHHLVHYTKTGEFKDSVEFGHWQGVFNLEELPKNMIKADYAFTKVVNDTNVVVPKGKFVNFNHPVSNPDETPNPIYIFGSIKTSMVSVDCIDGTVKEYK